MSGLVRPDERPVTNGDTRVLAIFETYRVENAHIDDLEALDLLLNDAPSSLSQPYADFAMRLRAKIHSLVAGGKQEVDRVNKQTEAEIDAGLDSGWEVI